MRNIYINESESVFEPFWDSGDSYPEHQKYSYLANYDISVTDKEIEKAETAWNGIKVTVSNNNNYSVKMKRCCMIDITDFDKFIFCAEIPKEVVVLIVCDIDGKKCKIIEENGGKKEYEGDISGKKIRTIEISFKNNSDTVESVLLSWMGLANSKKREDMLKKENGFDSEWEGCFCDEFEIKPCFELFFECNEIENIRKKVEEKHFSDIMEKLRKYVKKTEDYEPERLIGKYVDFYEPRFARQRDADYNKEPIWKVMENLAFVGLIDKNITYLKLACRCALSVSCCENWFESFVGNFPGATWHHRSFKEGIIAAACSKVLCYAGNLLTWYGKNIIYNAIIMKGIPRLEADLRTMDYIWQMNQGIVFSAMYIISLVTLEKKYPRYASLIEEAEKNINIMWKNYTLEDGGACEGAGYWGYSAEYYLLAMYVLAKRKKKDVQELCGENLKKSQLYAECMLSSAGDGTKIIPLNDTRMDKGFELIISAFFARQGKILWKDVFEKSADCLKDITLSAESIIIAPENQIEKKPKEENCFIALKDTGCICAKRNDTKLFLVSGPVTFGHSHEDKGSVLLESRKEALLIDRGVCEYGKPETVKFGGASWHNLLIPVKDGVESRQRNKECFGGEIIYAENDSGIIIMGTDISKVWEESLKDYRFIISPDPELIIIYDILEYKDETIKSAFILNTYGKVERNKDGVIIYSEKNRLKIIPVNYIPEDISSFKDGTDGAGNTVNRIRIITSKTRIITALILNSEKEAEFNGEFIKYKDYEVGIKADKVIINNKEYELF